MNKRTAPALTPFSLPMFALLVFALLFAGCAPKPPGLVGTWTGTYTVPAANLSDMSATLTLRADGTGSEQNTSPYGQVQQSFTYASDGKHLVLTMNAPALAASPGRFAYTLSGDALALTDAQEGGARFDLRRAPNP